MNKKVKKWLLGITAGLLYIALCCVKLTGGLVHVLLGAVFLIVMVVHMVGNKKRMKYVPKPIKIVDWVMLIAMITVVISGVVLHPMKEIMLVLILHKLSSVVLAITCVIHVVQHRKKKGARHVS